MHGEAAISVSPVWFANRATARNADSAVREIMSASSLCRRPRCRRSDERSLRHPGLNLNPYPQFSDSDAPARRRGSSGPPGGVWTPPYKHDCNHDERATAGRIQ